MELGEADAGGGSALTPFARAVFFFQTKPPERNKSCTNGTTEPRPVQSRSDETLLNFTCSAWSLLFSDDTVREAPGGVGRRRWGRGGASEESKVSKN